MLRSALLAGACLMATPALAQHHASSMDGPQPLLDGYGNGGWEITTDVPEAQAYFSNAMELGHAFAHQKAIDAARRAVELDPNCAMCLWADALLSGPTINYTVDAERTEENRLKTARAKDLAAANGTELERDLIAALEHRDYDGGGRSEGDLRYANAMRHLAVKHPRVEKVQTLTAAAIMNEPMSGDLDFSALGKAVLPYLEWAMVLDPDSTGAIHYYVHATEVAGIPEASIDVAEKLPVLAPKASHLVHMPSHVFYWVGRYQDAADVNLAAVNIGISEAEALGMNPNEGVWDLPYHVHNVVFGLGGALMADDAKTALELGLPLIEHSRDAEEAGFYLQTVAGAGYFAASRYLPLDETMALEAPKLPFLKALYHYARGEALARAGDLAGVKAELAEMPPEGVGERKREDFSLLANQTLDIAYRVLSGRIAMMEGRNEDAYDLFLEAAEIQEGEPYKFLADPPLWWFPVRRETAAAKLAMGDIEGAEQEIERALDVRPLDPVAMAMSGNVAD
ncbi:hypothetical protein [Sphingomicrobium clamense]|uniref:Tetratricopeptide repeat protein n=1 Tax=Sphingomicrobium clamense TaxID=2851013 RepID=A0ABS6V6P8_9SPHN|nr:hypothetical protein [Sphingomicrobium sp. B8]MBW0145203.1 hypothetical protein [Sphingomicrobium sp. B8]